MSKSELIPLSLINWKKVSFFLSVFINLINLSSINCKICKELTAWSEIDCFNNIIEINLNNGKYYRAGHFATNKNGDLIIEYSSDGKNLPQDYRLFYVLKKNGRGFFDDNYIKEKQLVKSGSYIGRYESRNIMIHLYENYDEEYLFSTSAYASVSELHDLENDNYKVADTQTFLGRRIFSYVYNILEAKEDEKTIYFIFYTSPQYNPDDDNGLRFVIKKLKFTEFKLDYTTSHIKSLLETKHNDRVICGFLFEENKALGALFIATTDGRTTYHIRLFDYSLNEIGGCKRLYEDSLSDPRHGHGKYLQAVYLKDNVVAFFYYHTKGTPLKLQVLHFTISNNAFSFDSRLFVHWEDFDFLTDEIYLNDIYKIADDKLAYASVESNTNQQKIYFLFLDFFNDFKSLKTRYYYFTTSFVINKEFQLYSYNGFIVFTTTINWENFNSILMFFSYPNGTDFEIDISPYIYNADEYISSNNIFVRLNSTMIVENNIFGYKSAEKIREKIRLVSIPEQLNFYSSSTALDTPLVNGDEIDINSLLYQNIEIVKNDGYYYLDYQFIVEDLSYSDLCSKAHGTKEYGQSPLPTPTMGGSKLYGRTNRLKFKLCHKFCETCIRYGMSDDLQHCETCLPQYNYDYLANTHNFTMGLCTIMKVIN